MKRARDEGKLKSAQIRASSTAAAGCHCQQRRTKALYHHFECKTPMDTSGATPYKDKIGLVSRRWGA